MLKKILIISLYVIGCPALTVGQEALSHLLVEANKLKAAGGAPFQEMHDAAKAMFFALPASEQPFFLTRAAFKAAFADDAKDASGMLIRFPYTKGTLGGADTIDKNLKTNPKVAAEAIGQEYGNSAYNAALAKGLNG